MMFASEEITRWKGYLAAGRWPANDAPPGILSALDEIERLREALDDAGNAIARVVACCTYGSEEQAKAGAYGISHEAFTEIDAFIRKHGDLLNALKGGE